MAETEPLFIEWQTMTCGECGVHFKVPSGFQRERKERGLTWYCPNGHGRVYRETDVERLTRELEAERTARRNNAARADKLEKDLASLTKRISAGVCPKCQRHFVNVERHMKAKHGGVKP